jgi:16S rRNA G966 N2-methylase RsmD
MIIIRNYDKRTLNNLSLNSAIYDLIYIDPPFNSNRNYEVFLGETKIPMVTEIIK